MNLSTVKHKRVFEIFEELSAIPHGSENCKKIAEFCITFAKEKGLNYYSDSASNVVIYKDGTQGLENNPPVILQGHLDMVCQKTTDSNINFLTDGITLQCSDDYIFANKTTLGGDNGIAVAMILAILESDEFKHPPIEAVFTSDEEIGMIGAGKLDTSVLKANRMINIDAEEDDAVIVSCAGGSDFSVKLPLYLLEKNGTKVTLEIKGLQGGHSGVEINSGRVNSNLLCGRILNFLKQKNDFDIISVNGGDKGNAITNRTVVEILSASPEELCSQVNEYINVIREEIFAKEKDFCVDVTIDNVGNYQVFSNELKDDLIYILCCIPNGVQEMSFEINNLVETSLNLGIVSTGENEISFLISLRSNKESALFALEDKLKAFFTKTNAQIKVSGFYPPWEYKEKSEIRSKYINAYAKVVGKPPKVEAIHAGLECAIFASKIKDIDCIAIGPNIFDVHTVNEKLSISSTIQIFEIILQLLKNL